MVLTNKKIANNIFCISNGAYLFTIKQDLNIFGCLFIKFHPIQGKRATQGRELKLKL